MKNRRPLTDRSTWIRLLYMLLFAGVLQVIWGVLALVAVVQVLSRLFTGETFEELRSLGGKIASFARDIVAFLTFHTEVLPFPFAPSRAEAFREEDELADCPAGS